VRCSELTSNKLSSVLDESSSLFIGLTSLSYLGLAANQIQSVSRRAFDGLDALRHVDVTDNDIGSLQDDAFTRLTNLQTMSVSPLTFSLSVSLSICLDHRVITSQHCCPVRAPGP